MNTDALLERMRANRVCKVEIGGVTISARVPTQYEMMRLHAQQNEPSLGDVAMRFAFDWSGIRVCDLVGGDEKDPVPFTPELFAEYAGDCPELLSRLADEIIKRYAARNRQAEAESGN